MSYGSAGFSLLVLVLASPNPRRLKPALQCRHPFALIAVMNSARLLGLNGAR